MSAQKLSIIAVDKQGENVLFVDPVDYRVLETITQLPSAPHELILLQEYDKAYVPIYGDGIHGDNPHPQHKVAVFSLSQQALIGFIELAPLESPHTGQLGRDGLVYLCCENSAALAVIDPTTDQLIRKITLPTTNCHRLAIAPSGEKLYTENEEDNSLCVVALNEGQGKLLHTLPLTEPSNGITIAPTGSRLILSSGETPQLFVLDLETHQWLAPIPLNAHQRPCQVVRYRDDGKVLVAIGDQEPVITLFDEQLTPLASVTVGEKPMDAAFSPDGNLLIVANESAGNWSVIELTTYQVIAQPPIGKGCETLSYFVSHS